MDLSRTNFESLATKVSEQIRDQILADGLQPGDVFMTEAGIAEQYGVSRNIVRESVSRVRALGLLESRQGKGLIVSSCDPAELLSSTIAFYGSGPEQLLQLAQFRYTLEVGAVDLAVENATESQVSRILAIAEQHAALLDQSNPQSNTEDQLELAFHTLILQMTHSDLIIALHRVLGDYFKSAARQISGWSQLNRNTVWQHRAIAQAIQQRDAEQARAQLRQHLYPIRNMKIESS